MLPVNPVAKGVPSRSFRLGEVEVLTVMVIQRLAAL
jgi:hypothetical protein